MGRVSDAKERLMKAVSELIWTGSYGSTTIDQICDAAGVKKGSFYYFFDSKADVAVAALDSEWKARRPELDAIFSPTIPPLERLRKYCEFGYQFQRTLVRSAAVCWVVRCSRWVRKSARRKIFCRKNPGDAGSKRKYLESAIRDAHAAGLVQAPDCCSKARTLFSYYQGVLTEARINNNLEILRDAIRGMYEILGVRESVTAAA